jgi:hypothetical protein
MRTVGLLLCVGLLAAGLLTFSSGRRGRSQVYTGVSASPPPPVKLAFAAARSDLDAADIEIREVTFIAADGSSRKASSKMAAFVRAGGKEQQVSTLNYG